MPPRTVISFAVGRREPHVNHLAPYPFADLLAAADRLTDLSIQPSPRCCVRIGNVEHCTTFDYVPFAVERSMTFMHCTAEPRFWRVASVSRFLGKIR